MNAFSLRCAMNKLILAITAALVVIESTPAHANDELDASYFTDGHALIVYGSLAGLGGAVLFLDVPDEPRFFDISEGGATYEGDTIPDSAVAGLAGLAGLALVATPTPARWYHVKGLAETFGTTLFFTEVTKRFAGRHRPDYVAGDPVTGTEDHRKSFFSGHSSMTLATTTYVGLYLRHHVFSRWRPASSFITWWEVAAYGGLAGISIYVPLSRVMDHRHHPTDVLVGSLVGMSLSAAFYTWQERRYRRSSAAAREHTGPDLAGNDEGDADHGTHVPVRAERGARMMLVPTNEPLGAAFLMHF